MTSAPDGQVGPGHEVGPIGDRSEAARSHKRSSSAPPPQETGAGSVQSKEPSLCHPSSRPTASDTPVRRRHCGHSTSNTQTNPDYLHEKTAPRRSCAPPPSRSLGSPCIPRFGNGERSRQGQDRQEYASHGARERRRCSCKARETRRWSSVTSHRRRWHGTGRTGISVSCRYVDPSSSP